MVFNRIGLFAGILMTMLLADVNAGNIWTDTAYESTSVPMEPVQVAAHSYYVQGPAGTPTDNEGFMSNAGFVVTDEGVVVFDALGTPSLAYLLLSKIREITSRPVVKVVVSHYHADHIYGLQVFKDLGAEIIAPAGASDYLNSPTAKGRLQQRRESLFPWVDEKTRLIMPDRYIDEPYYFQLGGVDFLVQPLGSTHSEGDQTLFVKQDHVLYVGDLIFEGRIPFVAGAQPEQWMAHLEKLDATSIEHIVPGHGPASNDPRKALAFTLEYLHFVHDNMANAVENLVPFDEAYATLDWSRYEKMPAAQANRMNAYYVYLGLEAASVGE
ncbi:MAG TPA: MBL fold metallo-hydrolase [Gammaproteobacteria bacterium]|nr:MBL fold metallo-hydrolase [Gammaproteobacteria bacterium]